MHIHVNKALAGEDRTVAQYLPLLTRSYACLLLYNWKQQLRCWEVTDARPFTLLTASLGVSSAGAGAVLVGVNDLLQLSHRRRGCIITKGQHHRFKESRAMDYHVMS
jgi:hypothetical protein